MSLDVSLMRKYHVSYDNGKTLEEKEEEYNLKIILVRIQSKGLDFVNAEVMRNLEK